MMTEWACVVVDGVLAGIFKCMWFSWLVRSNVCVDSGWFGQSLTQSVVRPPFFHVVLFRVSSFRSVSRYLVASFGCVHDAGISPTMRTCCLLQVLGGFYRTIRCFVIGLLSGMTFCLGFWNPFFALAASFLILLFSSSCVSMSSIGCCFYVMVYFGSVIFFFGVHRRHARCCRDLDWFGTVSVGCSVCSWHLAGYECGR